MQHTTITTWTKPLPDDLESDIGSKLQELGANGIICDKDIFNEDTHQVMYRKHWPDLASAESWREFVLSRGALTSVVNPVS